MKKPRNPKRRPLRPRDIKPDPVLTKLQQDYLAGSETGREAAAKMKIEVDTTQADASLKALNEKLDETRAKAHAAGVFKPHDANEMLHLLRGAIEKLASRLAPVLGPESGFLPSPHPTRSALAERLAGLTAEVEALTARVDV